MYTREKGKLANRREPPVQQTSEYLPLKLWNFTLIAQDSWPLLRIGSHLVKLQRIVAAELQTVYPFLCVVFTFPPIVLFRHGEQLLIIAGVHKTTGGRQYQAAAN